MDPFMPFGVSVSKDLMAFWALIIRIRIRFLMQAKVKDLKYPDMYLDSFMEFFGNCQGSGSVKVTQDSLEHYLSLQEHR